MLAAGHMLSQRYRVEGLLGQGGMGSVYRATHTKLGTTVAIKELHVLSPDPAEQRKFREQFEIEARILARLQHDNLARVTDFFEEGASAYLVMEFIEGRTLEDLVMCGTSCPDQSRALAVAEGMLDALEYLHAQRPAVIVRDLKPSNVMVCSDGRVRLIDFGIAKLLTPGQVTKSVVHGVGSDGFAPLEQYGMGSTDERTDLYALGATLLFVLTRQVPPEAVARVTQQAPLPDARALNPTVSSATWSAIQQLMAIAPADRRRRERLRAVQPFRGRRLCRVLRSLPRSRSELCRPRRWRRRCRPGGERSGLAVGAGARGRSPSSPL